MLRSPNASRIASPKSSEYLANVVMKLPAWHAALHEAKAHVAWSGSQTDSARQAFARAAAGFRAAGHPLDEARCSALERAV